MNKKVFALLILTALITISQTNVSYACVGARPMSMGGAFVSIADDVNAIYWNPAGLVQLEQKEVTYTRTMNNRDTVNYNDFIGAANYDNNLGLAYAVGYINVATDYPIDITRDGKLIYKDQTDSWYILSLGKKITDKLSIGGNIRQKAVDIELSADGYNSVSDSDSSIVIDLSALYHLNNKLSLGVLIQSANKPEFNLPDLNTKYEMIRNIRPSIAYKVDDSLTIAASIYDVTDEAGMDMSDRLRLGVEKALNDNLTVRVGKYGESTTIGAGYKIEDYQVDYAFLGDDLGDTHQLGITYKF